MIESGIIETCWEVSIAFRKERFINAKKVLNFIQSLTNEQKVIKYLTAFNRYFTIFSRHASISKFLLVFFAFVEKKVLLSWIFLFKIFIMFLE